MAASNASELLLRASRFRHYLADAKSGLATDFEWYPYDSLTNIEHIDRLLAGAQQNFFDLVGGDVLDIGCGDGDVSLFLESLGCSVVAVDHPRTHHNGMRGVRLLVETLQSAVEVREIDLDATELSLGGRKFSLVLALGLLYHLRNPFLLLDQLSRMTKYCLLSTRVTQHLPGMSADISGQPVAYLLGESELNDDNSNYWIFTRCGLTRLIERANWRILAINHTGDTAASDPISPKHDERIFCLLESHWAMRDLILQEGWHEPEQEGWRWTERVFSAVLPAPAAGAVCLTLAFYLPEAVIQVTGPLTLRCAIDGQELESQTCAAAGNYRYVRQVHTGGRDSVVARFEVSGCLPPDESDSRERSLIVAGLTLS